VVNVTDGAHVDVRLGTREFFFSHFETPKIKQLDHQINGAIPGTMFTG